MNWENRIYIVVALILFALLLIGSYNTHDDVQVIEVKSTSANVTEADLKIVCLNMCSGKYSHINTFTECLNTCRSYVE